MENADISALSCYSTTKHSTAVWESSKLAAKLYYNSTNSNLYNMEKSKGSYLIAPARGLIIEDKKAPTGT